MQKSAQERGLLNKLREQTNLTGKILENINPEFSEMMDRLRATDEKIRSHADQSKNLIRSAKSYLNRRDYLAAATNISAFHEKCRYIAYELNAFIQSVDMKHYKFLLDQFDDEQKEQLFGYNPEKKIEAALNSNPSLKKVAGLSDWWFKMTDPIADLAANLTTDRGRAMKALEKRFSISFLKSLKEGTIAAVNDSEKFLEILLYIFKKLATALAKRNVDQYIETAKVFINKFSAAGGYHSKFAKYYEKNIVPLKQQHEKLVQEMAEAKRLDEERKSKEMEEAANKPREEAAKKEQFEQSGLQKKIDEKFTSEPETKPRPLYPTQKDKEEALWNLRDKKSSFIAKIEKLSSEKELLSAILKFSSEIEDYSLDESLKLIAIAEDILDLPTQEEKNEALWNLRDNKPTDKMKISKDLPEGKVDKKYTDFPILNDITANKIRITPNTASHIISIFKARFDDLHMDVPADERFELNILNQLRLAIPRGIVLFNHRAEDSHNPSDRQLEIYTSIDLNKIDPSLKGTAKMKVLCRLSLSNNTLSIRTIQRKFVI